ncbi:MAG: ABC transporter permease subunit [Actinobacteria bacterium]|nr:ABC transporter permease subunit [Actinomycetota bacterium]
MPDAPTPGATSTPEAVDVAPPTQSVEHGAASADGPAKGMTGRAKFLLTVGPFAAIWLLWWRLGDLRLHQDKEAGITEWLYSVPRAWTVDWFDFAGRDAGAGRHKATGWVNVWFDHLRKKEFLDFVVNWHLSRVPWLILAVVLLAACAWKVWTVRTGRWLAAFAGVAWLAWSVDLFDGIRREPGTLGWVFLAAGFVTAAMWIRDRVSGFPWLAATTGIATAGWILFQTSEESFQVKVLLRRVAEWLEAPLDISEGLLIRGYPLQFGDFPWLGDREWLHLGVLPWVVLFAGMVGGGAYLAWQRRSGGWAAVSLLVAWYAFIGFYEPWDIPALPWIVIAGLFGVAGFKLGGWKLALLSVGFIVYASFIGEPPLKEGAETRWDKTMITLSAVLVTVPIAAAIGSVLGVFAAKRRRVEQFLNPLLNLTQAMPHFTFMIPIGVFIGVSHKAGVIATIAYAMPPMARLTILGIQGISKEVVEAGVMSGCTPRQMLWKVEMPAARSALLVGINQVVMECLAMVVIASFVGTAGLGQDLLFRLTGLKIGSGVEIGIAVVVMAITLDRFSQGLGNLQPVHHDADESFVRRHPYLLATGAVLAIGLFMANTWDAAQRVPKGWMQNHVRQATDWFVDNALVWSVYDWIDWLGWHLDDKIILPVQNLAGEGLDNALVLVVAILAIGLVIDLLGRSSARMDGLDDHARVAYAGGVVVVVVGLLFLLGDNRLGIIQSAFVVLILAGILLVLQRVFGARVAADASSGASPDAPSAGRHPYLIGAVGTLALGVILDIVVNVGAIQNARPVVQVLVILGVAVLLVEGFRRGIVTVSDSPRVEGVALWQQHKGPAGAAAALVAVVVVGLLTPGEVRDNLGGILQVAVVVLVVCFGLDVLRRVFGTVFGGNGSATEGKHLPGAMVSAAAIGVGLVVLLGIIIDGPVSQNADALKFALVALVVGLVFDTLRRGFGGTDGSPADRVSTPVSGFPALFTSAVTVGTGVFLALLLKGPLAGATSSIVAQSHDISLYQSTIWFRDHLERYALLPLRDAFLTVPWVAAVLLLFTIGWFVNGRRLAILASGFFAFIALSGFWAPAMFSLYQLTFAVFFAAAAGVPFGIWASASDRRNSVVQVLLDAFQTFPSFVYLLPAIMFFSVSDTAVVFAVVMSVGVPAIRYTIFGIRNIPHHLVEASTMSGCTKRQTLWKVKVPLAVPEIMLGINQTIMFGLFMVMIGGLIKTGGLARDLIEAQPNVDSGRAIIAGMAVAAIGMAVDMIISEWADKRKEQLGLIEA